MGVKLTPTNFHIKMVSQQKTLMAPPVAMQFRGSMSRELLISTCPASAIDNDPMNHGIITFTSIALLIMALAAGLASLIFFSSGHRDLLTQWLRNLSM